MIENVSTWQKGYVKEVTVEAGDIDSNGYAEISSSPNIFVGANPAGIAAGTYKLSVNVDAGGAADKDIVVTGTSMTWDQIATALTSSLTGATATITSTGRLRVTSSTNGGASSIVLAEGSTAGFIAAVELVGKYITTIEAPVDGADATSGYATISNTGALGTFTGATVPAITSATYDLDITVDGVLHQTATALLNTDDWDGIAAKIQVALRALTTSTETVAITAGKIQVTSATTGVTSTILIAAGTAGSGGGDLLAAITAISADYTATLDTPVAGVDATSGIAEVSTAPADLVAGTAAGLAAGTYNLSVNVDAGGAANIPVVVTGITMTWGAIVTALSSGLTGATASIVAGNLRVTSSSTGATSTIVIADGSGSGLLAAMDALDGTYVTTLETPSAGAEGAIYIPVYPSASVDTPSRSIVYQYSVRSSTGVDKIGLKSSYSTTTGLLTIQEVLGSSSEFAASDIVTVVVHFHS